MAVTALHRAALVTGAAKRIGRSIALALVGQGYAVALHCNRSRVEADALAAEIAAMGGVASVVPGDLSAGDGVAAIVEQAATALGPLSLLVNSASSFEADAVGTLRAEKWNRQFAVNAQAPILLTQAFAAQVAGEAPDPSVINLVDQRVLRPQPDYFSYYLSKAVLQVATQTLAQALAPRIRVNAIAPGPTLQSVTQSPEEFAAEEAATLLHHGSAVEDIVQAALFLASARSVTGQMLAVDAGQHLVP
ncbi:SDR family oxidoreductase [Labrys monachus]|uniref:NAD(P)-dependent dehydrogenase (Short-subunit alcohol dehydrogenase family) n=1 Tax=Labrys monachus TaxID=217067 RepID=A0ABU0FB18_9HYPH|nr:SDR family oxidoreductase [Labrys monachus]MDQ0391746.1 NAD(P)-dependent dehydrogenase (short-subunit alcohol dehydrogenase family) [Labrys monachus]